MQQKGAQSTGFGFRIIILNYLEEISHGKMDIAFACLFVVIRRP